MIVALNFLCRNFYGTVSSGDYRSSYQFNQQLANCSFGLFHIHLKNAANLIPMNSNVPSVIATNLGHVLFVHVLYAQATVPLCVYAMNLPQKLVNEIVI